MFYPKGGPFRKWYGNNWVVLAYYNPTMYDYLKSHGNRLPSESFYLQEGVTYCSSGSRGCSFRYMPHNQVISGAGPGIYPSDKFDDIYYYLGFLNSTLSTYLLECLNPTVNVVHRVILKEFRLQSLPKLNKRPFAICQSKTLI